MVLLILSNVQDLEAILHKVEWGTLLFFGGLFVLMEGLAELGLIRQLGDWMVVIVEVNYQLYNNHCHMTVHSTSMAASGV